MDTVSRNGVHKVGGSGGLVSTLWALKSDPVPPFLAGVCVWLQVLAVWRYDKREVNGAPVVYFGTELRAAPPGTIEHQVRQPPHDTLLKAIRFRARSGSKACRGAELSWVCRCASM